MFQVAFLTKCHDLLFLLRSQEVNATKNCVKLMTRYRTVLFK